MPGELLLGKEYVTRNAKISRLRVLPLEVQVIYRYWHFLGHRFYHIRLPWCKTNRSRSWLLRHSRNDQHDDKLFDWSPWPVDLKSFFPLVWIVRQGKAVLFMLWLVKQQIAVKNNKFNQIYCEYLDVNFVIYNCYWRARFTCIHAVPGSKSMRKKSV